MNRFIKQFNRKLNSSVLQLNCCHSLAMAAEQLTAAMITLPGDINILITAPSNFSDADCGTVYIDEFDIESPELPLDELVEWTENAVNCCRRINQAYNDYHSLNCTLSDTERTRIRGVWQMAQNGVMLPEGFSYANVRENKTENVIIGALRYTSKTLGTQTTVAKSALSADFPVGEQRDSWGFEPNYRSPSDSDIQTPRSSSTVNIGTGLITTTIEGDKPSVRDKKAAYWLVGILNEMVDAILADPPAKAYEAFLADGLLSADNLTDMSANGLAALVRKGAVPVETAITAQPGLLLRFLKDGTIDGRTAAQILPEQTAWIAKRGFLTAEEALEINPNCKADLIRFKLLPPEPKERKPRRTKAEIEAERATQAEQPEINSSRKPPVRRMRTASKFSELNSHRRSIPISQRRTAWNRRTDRAVLNSNRGDAVVMNAEPLNFKPYRFTNVVMNSALAIQPTDDVSLNSEDVEKAKPETQSVSESLQDTKQTGPAWLVRGAISDDIISNMIIPGKSKIEALDLFSKVFSDESSHIVSWDEPISDIQEWKQANSDLNYAVLIKKA